MSQRVVLMLIGGFFILLGIIAIIWDGLEKNKYFDTIARRPDTREFLTGWPPRPQFGALKTGGWIAIVLGVVLSLGGFFRWWG
ncbi:MAG: hypothetical protein HYX80_03175 [Chloroflexi bacterium]|nr:hypothetical protein [Chloroflexota bacterium]